MKTIKYSKLLFLLVILTFFACSEKHEITPDATLSEVNVTNGRLHFPSDTTYVRIADDLSSKSEKEVIAWESKFEHNSLLESNEEIDINIPTYLASVLNSKGEYQVGSTIVWINDGKVFKIANIDEELLKAIKASPNDQKFEHLSTPLVLMELEPVKNETDSQGTKATEGTWPTQTYEYIFIENGIKYRIAFISRLLGDGYYNSVYVYNLLQYDKSKHWYQASQFTQKAILGLEWRYAYNGVLYSGRHDNVIEQNDSQELKYKVMGGWPQGGENWVANDLRVSAYFNCYVPNFDQTYFGTFEFQARLGNIDPPVYWPPGYAK